VSSKLRFEKLFISVSRFW